MGRAVRDLRQLPFPHHTEARLRHFLVEDVEGWWWDRRREQRRSYEWKITLGLWAGLILSSKFLAESADDLTGQITGDGAT